MSAVGARPLPELFGAIQRRALAVALVAGALTALGASSDPDQFLRSYLMAFLFWIAFPLGSMALVMLHQLTGGSWGFAVRRLLEASMRTLPLMALAFVPILLGRESLFVWADPEAVAADPLLQTKQAYLNVGSWMLRAAVFFGLWLGISWVLGWLIRRQDRTGDERLEHRLRMVSGPGLGLYALTMTFAAVDWAMSLEPHWFSTVYGVLFIVSQGLATLCLAVFCAAWLAEREPFSRWLARSHFHDLGNLMLAFVLLWAYVSFSQYLIIWSADLAEEAPWYLRRTGHGWQVVAFVLIVFHFFVPFWILLFRRAKRAPRFLARLALVLIVARAVDLYWLIAPAFHPESLHLSWMDVAVPVAMGGLWVAFFVQNLKGRPLISLQDASLQGSLEQSATG